MVELCVQPILLGAEYRFSVNAPVSCPRSESYEHTVDPGRMLSESRVTRWLTSNDDVKMLTWLGRLHGTATVVSI